MLAVFVAIRIAVRSATGAVPVSDTNVGLNKAFAAAIRDGTTLRVNSTMRAGLIVILQTVIMYAASGQALLKGRVMDSQTDSILSAATVSNLSQHINKASDAGGRYSIIAMPTDSIVFSAIGYRPDTIVVSKDLMQSGFDAGLKRLDNILKKVIIRQRTYAEDSAARQREYARLTQHPPQQLTTAHDANDGFGLRFSPITYFSKKQRAQRRLKRQLVYQEEQAYVDYYFSRNYVHRVTGLSHDSLQSFMVKYRPSYKDVRTFDSEDLLRYINDAFIRFRHPLPASDHHRKLR